MYIMSGVNNGRRVELPYRPLSGPGQPLGSSSEGVNIELFQFHSNEWQQHEVKYQEEAHKQLLKQNQVLTLQNRQLLQYNAQMKEQQRQLLEENQKLKSYLKAEQQEYASQLNRKDEEIKSLHRNMSYEKMSDNFYKHYHYLEMELSRELERSMASVNKQEFRKIFCDLYQKSFLKCRDVIQGVFHDSLIEITELSNEEEESGKVNIGRQRSLINAKAAYEYLLIHCETKLNTAFDKVTIANEVLTSLSVDNNLMPMLLEQAINAVDICWKMQTVSPPMFLCQPKIYSEEWHDLHARSWHDPPGELIYYRPVLMYSAGGLVAHKGLVGSEPKTVLNTHQSTDRDLSSPVFNPAMGHTTCSVCGGGSDNFTDGRCARCYKNAADRSKQEKQLEKKRVADHKNESLPKITHICSICTRTIQYKEPGIQMRKYFYHKSCFTCCKCNKEKERMHDVVVLCDGSIIWCGECAYTCHFCESTLSGKKHLLQSKLACERCLQPYQIQNEGFDHQSLLIVHERIAQKLSLYHCRFSCSCIK